MFSVVAGFVANDSGRFVTEVEKVELQSESAAGLECMDRARLFLQTRERLPLACQVLAPPSQGLCSEPVGTAARPHWTGRSGGIELPARHDG